MTKKWLLALLSMLAVLWATDNVYPQAPKPSKTLTILYSNNLNGEIDPCPT